MQRIVTKLPLTDLWDDAGPVPAIRRRDLTAADIRELLRASPVQFVVANVAEPLQWIPVGKCFPFWKAEVQRRVADTLAECPDDYPEGYCYFASEWIVENGLPTVVLSVAH